MKHRWAIYVFVGCLLPFLAAKSSLAAVAAPSALDAGYRQMYNLDFVAAHKTFESWEATHPDDPLGPVSNAAAYLFSEFDRLHILESELFTNDRKFQERAKRVPDPAAQSAFDGELARGERIADRILSKTPQHPDALFAKALASGLRSDYTALIEKRNMAGLNYMKNGRALAERLLALDPSYYDAYLAVGVENYFLSLHPTPVRWMLRMGGAQTSKQEGIAKLRITAEKGRYLAPYARLLLAVAALRDHDQVSAARLLSGLAEEFPRNPLYRRELARLRTQAENLPPR